MVDACLAKHAPRHQVVQWRYLLLVRTGTMMIRLRFPILLMMAALLVACASNSSGSGRGVGNVLTYDDLVATNETNLYMAIQSLRPRWLRPRGQTSFVFETVVTVFVNGSPEGDASDLIGMPITGIVDVTYLSASEATFRFGTIAGSGGSLEIETRR